MGHEIDQMPLPPAPPPSPTRHRIKQGGLVSGTGSRKQLKQQRQSPLSPREQFTQYYGITLPPVPPQLDSHHNGIPQLDLDGGLIMAGRFISSISSSESSDSSSSQVIKGWNDGTTHWRSAVYNYLPQSPSDPFYRTTTLPRSPYRPSTSAPAAPSALENDQLIAKFNDQFKHSRTQSSTVQSSPTKKERPLLSPAAKGKLLVPDVKLKVRCGSSASIDMARASTPTSSTKSPLSVRSDRENEDVYTSFTLKRPTFETRSWSYDNVQTYPIMQLPPKMVKKIERQIVDGEEQDVEVEVEVHEERKRLFLFAPTVVMR